MCVTVSVAIELQLCSEAGFTPDGTELEVGDHQRSQVLLGGPGREKWLERLLQPLRGQLQSKPIERLGARDSCVCVCVCVLGKTHVHV